MVGVVEQKTSYNGYHTRNNHYQIDVGNETRFLHPFFKGFNLLIYITDISPYLISFETRNF